ncbi:MAG: dipeptidase [bacterium]
MEQYAHLDLLCGREVAPINWRELHEKSLVIDGHFDTLSKICAKGQNIADDLKGQVDLGKLSRGGVDAAIFAVFVESPFRERFAIHRAAEIIGYGLRQIDKNPESLTLVRRFPDIERAKKKGKIGVILSLEGAEPVGESLETLRAFYELGIRNIGLTWFGRNQVADGCGEKHAGGGLTDFGIELIKAMGELGVTVDVSHLSERGFWDIAENIDGPFIASHSNCAAICPHERNLTDDQIKALAGKGGVVGINFFPEFLNPRKRASLSDILDHIDHIASLVGVDHVALGSDFDGIRKTPAELPDVSHLPLLTEKLAGRGYSERDIRKILGENYLRVFKAVWK